MKLFIKIYLLIFSVLANANCLAGNFEDIVKEKNLVGYTIVYQGIVTGYIQNSAGKQEKSNSFAGCDFGRKIIFDNKYAVTCSGYSYHYSFRPNGIILVKDSYVQILIDAEIFEGTLY